MKQVMNILVCSRLFYPFPNSFVINAMENQINFLSLSSAVKNAISSTETWLWVCIFKQFGSPCHDPVERPDWGFSLVAWINPEAAWASRSEQI